MATALVIHAHPDDEVFATGAATIGLAEAGWRVVLRVATGGEAGEDPRLPEAVARARRAERLTRSSELLGIAEWDWLAEPGRWIDDGGVAGPRSPAASQTELLIEIRRQLDEIRPELVLSVGSDGLTGHPDHVAVAAAVRRAATVEVLGARVRSEDVRAAHAHLDRLAPGKPVGSGRVVGCPDDVPLREIAGGTTAEQRRREALDQYAEGLGTSPLEQVLTDHLGDGVLLRALFDVAGWQRDLFESEAPAGVR